MSVMELEARAGEPLAVKIKNVLFYEQPWSVPLAWKIGEMMAKLKRNTKIRTGEKDVFKVFEMLARFDKDDLEEMLSYDSTKVSPGV